MEPNLGQRVYGAYSPLVSTQFVFSKKEETRYECAIDDTMSFNEVMEDYEVVEQRGDIWVLREKVEE